MEVHPHRHPYFRSYPAASYVNRAGDQAQTPGGSRRGPRHLGREPVTGKKRQLSKTVHGDAKAANEVLRDLIENRAPCTDGMGGFVRQAPRSVARRVRAPRLSPTTLRAYRSQVEQTIRPALGNIALTRLMRQAPR